MEVKIRSVTFPILSILSVWVGLGSFLKQELEFQPLVVLHITDRSSSQVPRQCDHHLENKSEQ